MKFSFSQKIWNFILLQGFENLMASPAGRQIFEKYLKGEFSAENLIFWNACNDLKSVKKKEIFNQKVEKIFINHLETSSPHEVEMWYWSR